MTKPSFAPKRLGASLLLLLGLALPAGAEAPVKIYVFSGQSNMGVSAGERYIRENHPEIHEWVHSEENDVLYFWTNTPGDAGNEPGMKLGDGSNWGYEIIMGYHLDKYWQEKDPEQDFVIVKYAQAAAGIKLWNPGHRPAGQWWHLNEKHPWTRPAQGYKVLMGKIREAIGVIEEQGRQWEGGAFIWYQGESDAAPVISSHHAKVYPERFSDLVLGDDELVHHPDDPPAEREAAKGDDPEVDRIVGVRTILESPEMPVIMARIIYYDNSSVNMSILRDGIRQWCHDPAHQPADWINTDDLETSDGVHLSNHSVVTGAERFFAAYRRLIEPGEHTFPPYMKPTRRLFGESFTGTLHSRTDGAAIYFTLDGTEPTEQSTRYSPGEELYFAEDTTVKAIAVAEGRQPSIVRSIPLDKLDDPWPAVDAEVPGELTYTVYAYDGGKPEKGAFVDVSDLEVIHEGTATTLRPELPDSLPQSHVIRFEGYLHVPRTDTYRFRSPSADAGFARMRLDEKTILGPGGMDIHVGLTRHEIPLEAGPHAFTYTFIHLPDSRHNPSLDWKSQHFARTSIHDKPEAFGGTAAVARTK